MVRKWHDDGYYGPLGDWPGGHRYGVQTERFLRERHWSDEDRELARQHQIVLPKGLGWYTSMTWWDLPVPQIHELVWEPAQFDGEHLTQATFSEKVTYARRWAFGSWDYDPLRALRRRA